MNRCPQMSLVQFDTNYFARSDGAIFSNKRGTLNQLKPFKHRGSGYPYVYLCGNGMGHRQVNAAWIIANHLVPNPERFSSWIHLDRDHMNCNVENIRWVEKSLPYAGNLLTPEDVEHIENAYNSGRMSRQELADRYDLRISKVHLILRIARDKGRISTHRRDCYEQAG